MYEKIHVSFPAQCTVFQSSLLAAFPLPVDLVKDVDELLPARGERVAALQNGSINVKNMQ